MPRSFSGYFLGRRRYAPTHELMLELFEARKAGKIGDTLLFLEHEPVITLGRGTKPEHLLVSREALAERGVELSETGRGGDITLHAPGQLVAYPILDLAPDRQDVRRYVKDLTEVMRRLTAEYGIATGTYEGFIGLWTDAANPLRWQGPERAASPVKLGAIGVRISRWVTMHGFALNLTTDLDWFRLIVPCGISQHPVASVASLGHGRPDVRAAAERAYAHFADVFGAEVLPLEDGVPAVA
jgi:lipoyl(octanoyl) transferase